MVIVVLIVYFCMHSMREAIGRFTGGIKGVGLEDWESLDDVWGP